MLLGVLTVLVVLASGEPDGAVPALEQALRSALPEGAKVLVRPRGDASDGAWLSAGRDEKAALVGVVTWSEKQRHVTVHFVRPEEGRWADREIRFDATDATTERGRTVGFALASMVPEEVLAKASAEAAANAAAAANANATANANANANAANATNANARAPSTPNASANGGSASPSPPPPRVVREEPPATPLGARGGPSIEAVGLGAIALGGYGGGLGASLAGRVPLGGGFRVRIAASARSSDVAPAQASSRVYAASAGLAWQTWVDAQRRWSAGARVEGAVQRHQLVHFSADDPEPATQARFVPAVAGALEVGWRFTEQAAIVGAVGLEAALGTSSVIVRGQQVAEIAPLRGIGEAGLRVSF